MRQVGQRVGAICNSDQKKKVVNFFGYGVYEGDKIPPADAGGFASMCHEAECPNPCIKLDNGDIVWGGECWWGGEEKIKTELEKFIAAGFKIKTVRIADLRAEEKKNAATEGEAVSVEE